MMIHRLAPLLLLLTLTACGGGGGGGGTPQAGRYQVKVTVTKFDVPGLDAPRLNAMQRALVGKPTKYTYCLSDEAAGKKAEALFAQTGEGTCKLHQFNPRGGKIDVLMTCRAISGRQSFALKGVLNASSAQFIADGVVDNRRFPRGRALITREVSMKRIADCTPPAVPGKKKG